MWSRITTMATVEGFAYMQVQFWPDQAASLISEPALTNDFLFSRIEQFQSVVVDELGQWQVASGAFVVPWIEVGGYWQPRPDNAADPYVWQTVTVDLAAEAVDLIKEFAIGHADTVGDLTDHSLVVEPASGIAARADLQDLVGSEREV